jgi:hypothetical protein
MAIFNKYIIYVGKCEQGCQMAYFQTELGYILECLGMENVGIFYDHFEYFIAIWFIF